MSLAGLGMRAIALHGWLLPAGGVGTQATYVVRGSCQRDVVSGALTFHPAGAGPFGGVVQPDGRLVLTPRFPGSTAVSKLVFAAR